MNLKSKLLVALLATLPVAAYAAPATLGSAAGVEAEIVDSGNIDTTGGLGLAYKGLEWVNHGTFSHWTAISSSILTGDTQNGGNIFGSSVLGSGSSFVVTGGFGALTIFQTYTLTTADVLNVSVTITNTGREAVKDVQWGVGFDPDVNIAVGAGFDTINTIVGQGANAAVSAVGTSAFQKVTLANTTTASAFSIAAYIDPTTCCSPIAPSTALAAAQAVGFMTNADNSISLAYDIGTLAIGQTATLGYSYTFESLPVPEADTYGMMLAGLGLMGLMARRRQA